MNSITHAARAIPETELDPAGRYVVAWSWGDRRPLAPGDTEDRQRVVYDADDYADETGRYDDVDHLAPGRIYDRTMDVTWPVTRWLALRAELAEDTRKRDTLKRVEHDRGMPRRKHQVEVIAVTEDGERHHVTVAERYPFCSACGAAPDGHDDGQRHTFRPRIANTVASAWRMRLEFPEVYRDDPPWLAEAFRRWSAPSVRLAEMLAAGEITWQEYDAVGASLTESWWRYHDDQWAGWSARLERDKRVRQPGNYVQFPKVIKRRGQS